MEITRDVVNQWLEQNRRGRDWLAEKCGVGIAAVGHWLNVKGSARPIPAEHQITISTLMDADLAAESEKHDENRLSVVFRDDDFSAVEQAAQIVSTPIKDFIVRSAVHAAKAAMQKAADEAGRERVRKLEAVEPEEDRPAARKDGTGRK